MEKSILPLAETSPKSNYRFLKSIAVALVVGLCLLKTVAPVSILQSNKAAEPQLDLCPMVEKVNPLGVIYNNDTLDYLLHDETFKAESAERLSKAIQVPTEVFDTMVNPNTTDSLEELFKVEPRWKPFIKFHEFLEETYPLIHKHLKVEKVNKLGLIYTWEGSTSKKPLLLTAHQDVVPIQKETVPQWTYPPYSGHIADGKVHGRGALDCKNLLTGLMDTIEILLSEGQFTPQRTVILAYGFDEESGGPQGAYHLGQFLLERYGEDSIYQLIDEGNAGFSSEGGVNFITPATGEKGYLDSVIELYTPGGHSSVPPPHTLIGIMSELVSLIEKTPFDSVITERNPVLHHYQCVAEYSDIDSELKKAIQNAHQDKKANDELLEYLTKDLRSKFLVTTSQAVDIVTGGVKANALPEHAQILINSRIAVEESVESTAKKFLKNVLITAARFKLGVYFDGKEILPPTEHGYFNYSLVGELNPAPVTPLYDEVWNTFGGALRFLYEDLVYPEDDTKFVFSSLISTGNTDTKRYWGLTSNIFRYMPGLPGMGGFAHSVNEFVTIESHTLVTAFYYYYIQLVDQFD